MLTELTPVECRILGSLAEKSITVKDQYPLSFNSLLLACNQKSSRDPVMSLDAGTLGKGIESLLEKGLVQKHLYSGERSIKYSHCLSSLLDTYDERTTALFIVLMLRGPQTAAELKTRTERLYAFKDTAETEALLQQLASMPNPMLAKAPRRPGQKDGRYTHLFCGMPAVAEEMPSRQPLVFIDKTEERIQLLENKVAMLEKWLKEFSEGTFVPYEKPDLTQASPDASLNAAAKPAVSENPDVSVAETATSESVRPSGLADSEVSVSGKFHLPEGTSPAAEEEDGGHDAPPGRA
ncbi:MAG: YceH family protein [Elusimicrobiales bacterium]|nr:YceH family protein [Elusimicrobiales bacterium]